jgi:hypothetical protein
MSFHEQPPVTPPQPQAGGPAGPQPDLQPTQEQPMTQYFTTQAQAAPAVGTVLPMPYVAGGGIGIPLPPGPPPAALPPVPPDRGRSAAWWIGVSASVAAAAVLLLLAGFFVGRSSRMSDDQVQTKITQQAQADQIAQ